LAALAAAFFCFFEGAEGGPASSFSRLVAGGVEAQSPSGEL
jgi:hypothetical protein